MGLVGEATQRMISNGVDGRFETALAAGARFQRAGELGTLGDAERNFQDALSLSRSSAQDMRVVDTAGAPAVGTFFAGNMQARVVRDGLNRGLEHIQTPADAQLVARKAGFWQGLLLQIGQGHPFKALQAGRIQRQALERLQQLGG